MSYRIIISQKAEKDIIEAADYIEFILHNPKAADDLLDKVTEEIENLSVMPAKFGIVDEPVLKAWGIRFFSINNSLVFCRIDEAANLVNIVRFLYGKRNWKSILRMDVQ
ncbi:toxin RelE [Anaerovibrio lipolyticus]|uniref:Toxin RelE n=1 Tax=Anaerovibrio lipolyticus TaxID=82374 RepID=A0A0B2K2R9_9FIRM|nr:type II toxin-antitoxin system RelE/ParE family toxin [Anaerovibrio lipolyticus]KHM53066.1 toxin RelE [Anaerovibrio lipolyticus]